MYTNTLYMYQQQPNLCVPGKMIISTRNGTLIYEFN